MSDAFFEQLKKRTYENYAESLATYKGTTDVRRFLTSFKEAPDYSGLAEALIGFYSEDGDIVTARLMFESSLPYILGVSNYPDGEKLFDHWLRDAGLPTGLQATLSNHRRITGLMMAICTSFRTWRDHKRDNSKHIDNSNWKRYGHFLIQE